MPGIKEEEYWGEKTYLPHELNCYYACVTELYLLGHWTGSREASKNRRFAWSLKTHTAVSKCVDRPGSFREIQIKTVIQSRSETHLWHLSRKWWYLKMTEEETFLPICCLWIGNYYRKWIMEINKAVCLHLEKQERASQKKRFSARKRLRWYFWLMESLNVVN